MKRQAALHRLTLRDNGFAFDPGSGRTYTFSDTGRTVVELMRDGCPEAELADRLVDAFDIDRLSAQRDVDAFLANLRSYKLL
jgi:coenzyme PQQ synthesis protein D (PqqD)